ncbi:Basic-leucine zipper transcription factor [Parasponia andersonii]|uniref:Basic-leucine zipper transcription factor n=1 Tax=Parasponia andersonii TaxID=3476 RepID=A0A2P5CVH7_PARAD|nr:Basic-leucine zipper transcription factor [Parasponia andersonii]
MGSNINFKSIGNDPSANGGGGGGGGRPPGNNNQLVRQSSIYSLTFDEFQSTMRGIGKDFGSMNMDELLKNIWSAEEIQTMASVGAAPAAGQAGVGAGIGTIPLQRQGSLTLPRTLSQKTVDEVWRDLSKDGTGAAAAAAAASNLPQRQQTLGEVTLEEFLVRAGVVREDNQLAGKPQPPSNNGGGGGGGFFGELARSGIDFEQTNRGTGMVGNRIQEASNQISIQAANLPLNVNGMRSNQQPLPHPHQQRQHQQHHHQQQQIYPKQPTVTYATQLPMQTGGQLGSPGVRSGIMGITDQGLSNALVQGGGMGTVGLGGGAVTMGTGSPANQISSDGMKSNGDTSSVSPVPLVFNGGWRGRKSGGAVEKVAERRQRRMIKNRESAARSRARKQAYTMELEAEVAKLKEENEELRKKQDEIMEMQKDQVTEMINMQRGVKKCCLRRTQTGPW